MQTIRFTAAAIAFFAAASAQAASPTACAHPALARAAACTAPAGIDANTFIVQPPASTRWVAGHANHEHPAVVIARRSHAAEVDANTFLVQPPVAVSWTVQEPDRMLAASPAAPAR